MLDISYIRDNLELCKKAAKDKNREVDWDSLIQLDDRRRELIGAIEKLRAERNIVSSKRKEEGITRGKEIKSELKKLEEELRSAQDQFSDLMLTVPNVADSSVPVGKDASGNREIKKWGIIPTFDFEPKDHVELAKLNDLIDFERGAKVGGSRAYFLKNEAAVMELSIMMWALQKLVAKGYIPLIAPCLVKDFTLFGSGQFPWGREEVYSIEKDGLFLAGTAEVPVTSYYSGELLVEKDLPKKFVAFSLCFRREAGSYGKDTRGIYRIHQFNKIEQVIITTAEMSKSITLHEELLRNAEELLKELAIPYRVMLMCTGDMGEPQVKKYDIEAWMPGRENKSGKRGDWGETMSNSFMGDFQARRLKIRYRAKDGQILYAHTLNNTALASPRILVAILENYQQKDGSIKVPFVLQKWIGKEVIKKG